VKATLKDIILDGSQLSPPAAFNQPTILSSSASVLEHGVGVTATLAAAATFQNFRLHEIQNQAIALSALNVYVIDSFGVSHALSVGVVRFSR